MNATVEHQDGRTARTSAAETRDLQLLPVDRLAPSAYQSHDRCEAEQIGILEAKLSPPPTQVSLVERTRLVRRLIDAGPASITLVAAPAGYGKTSLLSSYAGSAHGQTIAWVSLDHADNSSAQFWLNVTTAVHRACKSTATQLAATAAKPSTIDVENTLIPLLINGLHQRNEPLTIVLDDLHHVEDPLVLKQLSFVAERLPVNCRLIAASRTEPELPLARWRVHGKLLEIRSEQLALDHTEAEMFLNDRLDLDLSASSVSSIWRRAEGWPAGIYLAALGLRDRPNRDEFVAGSQAGFDIATIEYMTSEVLANLAPEVRQVLARLSILERINGGLADAVLQSSGGSATMTALARENLFISAQDATCSWFRIHPTLRSFLQTELELTEPDMPSELHRRAVEWHVENGHVTDALAHACAVPDHALVAELVQQHWIDLVRDDDCGGLERAVGQLTDAGLLDGTLVVPAAWIALQDRLFDEVDRLVASIDPAIVDERSKHMIPVIIAARHLHSGRIGDALASALDACTEADLPTDIAPLATELAGSAAVWAGDFETAETMLNRTLPLGRDQTDTPCQASARGQLALLLADRLQLGEARNLAKYGLQLAVRSGAQDLPQTSMIYIALGVVSRREGRTEEAIEHLERGVRLARYRRPTEAAYAILTLAGVLRKVDNERARELVAEARSLLEECEDPGQLLLATWERDSRSLRRRSYGGAGFVEELTERELDHLRLLPTELSRREIADRLMVSYNTVKSNSRAIFRKLGVNSRIEAVAFAREVGLI